MCRKIIPAVIALFFTFTLTQALEVGEPAPEFGTVLDLSNGERVQLLVVENQILAYFLDSEGLVAEATADSIILEVDDPPNRNDEWRGLLQPAEDAGLICPKRIFAPHEIRVRLIIRYPEAEPITLSKLPLNLTKALAGE